MLQVLAGMAVFFMTGLKAMFLDFSFTAICPVRNGGGVPLVAHGANHRALPQWHVRTEPIYAICKAIFTMSLVYR